jgi:hypothetical protein
VVSPGFEARDPQGHAEREEGCCPGNRAQDAQLGRAFGQPPASEGEARSAEYCKEISDNGREDSCSAVELRDQVEQVLRVLLKRLDGGDRAQTSPSPGGNGGPWDLEMPGERPRTSAEHLLPQTVVVGTARLWRGREVGLRASIARRGSASEILSDSEGGALAYGKLGKVFARSWEESPSD